MGRQDSVKTIRERGRPLYESVQKEREKILADNKNLHNEVEQIKVEYKKKESDIKWICKKFDMGAEDNLIRDFERDNNTLIDAEKQVK